MERKNNTSGKEQSLNLCRLGNWVNREYMKRFFDYGDTQILALSKEKKIKTSRYKNRLFFDIDSVLQFLEENVEIKKN